MLCMQSLNSENYGRTTVGEMPQNRALNRFKHIVPCETSINIIFSHVDILEYALSFR